MLHAAELRELTRVDLLRQLGDVKIELQSSVARIAKISDNLAIDTSQSPDDARQSERPFMGEEVFRILLDNLSRMGRECDRINAIYLGQDASNNLSVRV